MRQPTAEHKRSPVRRALLRSFFAVLFLLTPLPALGQQGAPLFLLHTRDGALEPAPLQKIREDWSIRLGEVQSKEIPGNAVVSLRRFGLVLPAPVSGPQVMFSNGDRVRGHIARLDTDRLYFSPTLDENKSGAPELALPLSSLLEVWFISPRESAPVAEAFRRLQN